MNAFGKILLGLLVVQLSISLVCSRSFKVSRTVEHENEHEEHHGNRTKSHGKRQTSALNVNNLDGSLHLLDEVEGGESHRPHTQVSLDDLTDDLKDWEAPDYIRENFPYYQLGYDEDGRPIWSAELGKMDLRGMIEERGKEGIAALEKYTKQVAYRILRSMNDRSTEDQRVTEILYLIDFDGLEMRQLSYVPSLTFFMKLCRSYQDLITKHLAASYIINANFVAENLIRLVKPVFGPAMAKVEIYGTKKSKWMPVLRRSFGSNLPQCYGGQSKKFKPVAFYG